MGDRFQTEIEIGGTLPASAVVAFMDALADDGLQVDWAWGPTPKLDDVLQAPPNGPLHFVADEGDGEFPLTEDLCRELGLSYRRTLTGKLGTEGTITIWRPGMDLPRTSCADQHGRVSLSLDELRAAGARGEDLDSVLTFCQPLADTIPRFVVGPVEPDPQRDSERGLAIEHLVALEPTIPWRDRERLADGLSPLTLVEARAELDELVQELD